MPTKTEIRAAIVKVVKHTQDLSGRACPPITDATKPIGDLEGFDSLSGVEATSLLEQELGLTLADGSAFVDEAPSGKKRALTVDQAVAQVEQMLATPRAA